MQSDKGIEEPGDSPRTLRLAASSRPSTIAPPVTIEERQIGNLVDYLRVLHKRRWTAATAFLIIVASVTTYTFTATSIYEARTRLLIEADGPNVINFAEVVDEQRTKADYYQTQYNILQSRLLARKTIQALQLWDNPYLGGGSNGGFWTRLIGFGSPAHPAPGQPNSGETLEQSRTIDKFLDNLTVSPIRNSRLVDIKYRLPDPDLAM